jgi:hypothetical protein
LVVESTYNWYWLVDGLQEAGYETKAEALQLIAEAIEMHLEDLREHGKEIPEPHLGATVRC